MTNQLSNPSVETDTTGYVTASATITRRTPAGGATAPDGANVLEQVYVSGTNMLVNTSGMTVPASPGQTWSAGVYARFTTGTARTFRCDIQWMDASDSVISTVNGGTVTITGSFAQYKNEGAVAPALTDHIRIRTTYITAVAGETIETDAWQLEQGATLPAYNPVTGGGSITGELLLEDGTPLALEDFSPLLLET